MGNSSGIILPKFVLTELGVKAGDGLSLTFEAGKLVLTPIKPHPRIGWSDAAKAIAAHGDDSLVWPEFGNAGDDDLAW